MVYIFVSQRRLWYIDLNQSLIGSQQLKVFLFIFIIYFSENLVIGELSLKNSIISKYVKWFLKPLIIIINNPIIQLCSSERLWIKSFIKSNCISDLILFESQFLGLEGNEKYLHLAVIDPTSHVLKWQNFHKSNFIFVLQYSEN